MITGALIGACLFSVVLYLSNIGPATQEAKARALSVFMCLTCLGALIGSNF